MNSALDQSAKSCGKPYSRMPRNIQLPRNAQMPIFIASMMGVITGIFGGVARDIVCNEVPMVFRDGKPYAICAFLGNWMFLGMREYGFPHDFALWSSALFISGLRLITWKFDLRLGR